MRELEDVAAKHDQTEGFTPRLIACRAHTLATVVPSGSVLDLGCADGLLTAHLAKSQQRVLGVDASATRLSRARERTREMPNVELRRALFDELSLEERFDAVVISCVLEHVASPQALLRRAANWLRPEGKIVAIVPHAGSLHRRLGQKMGILLEVTDPGSADEALEHRRVYTRQALAADFAAAGLEVIDSGGYLIKPLPNEAMATLEPRFVDACEELGRELPDLAAEIYAVGRPR
ncbi:MAG TPA: class I SAM-dependent methyltransferase [Thermoanaerobaculia bacterium]|nr:class I SAM-dependent methyltransferase [Thermoanaerobaculia bacterium]